MEQRALARPAVSVFADGIAEKMPLIPGYGYGYGCGSGASLQLELCVSV